MAGRLQWREQPTEDGWYVVAVPEDVERQRMVLHKQSRDNDRSGDKRLVWFGPLPLPFKEAI